MFTLVSKKSARKHILRAPRFQPEFLGPHNLIHKQTRMKRTAQNNNFAKRQRKAKGFSGTSAPVYRQMKAPAGEMKYFDTTRTSNAIVAVSAGSAWPAGTMQDPGTTINLGAAAVANPLCLFAPTVGSALNQRIGRSVLVRKVKMRGQVILPAALTLATTWQSSAPYPPVKVRLLLVQDMQTNAAQMAASALLNDASDTGVYPCQLPKSRQL